MSEKQIKELAETRQVTDKVFIVAPATGFILARNVSPDQRFEKGFEWYRMANLDRVWVLADLFTIDGADPMPGMRCGSRCLTRKRTFRPRWPRCFLSLTRTPGL